MDYNTMPNRVSTLATEIESKKVLQDEQVRAALDANKRLLYYVSGGKEHPDMGINDKVRPEDQDLRGWFTEKYGNYLAYLTSDSEATKTTSDRVAQIIADFNETPFGYVLRTGAVNEYHIGRIVSYAKKVNEHRTEARKYSKDLTVLCAKLLFSGEPPNNNVFDILHSSIRNWYTMQGVDVKIPFEQMIASGSIFNDLTTTYNHASYCSEIIFALFDMHAFPMSADSWHKFTLPSTSGWLNAGGSPMTVTQVEEFFNATDGYGSREKRAANDKIRTLNEEYKEALKIAQEAETQGWNVEPKLTQEIKDTIQNQVTFATSSSKAIEDYPKSPVYAPFIEVSQNIAAYQAVADMAVGEALPRNIKLIYPLPVDQQNIVSGRIYRVVSTNSSYINYDTWKRNKDLYTLRWGEINALIAERDADTESGASAADFHKVPSRKIYFDQGESLSWLIYVYARARAAWNLPYLAYFPIEKQMPGLAIPALPGQQVDSNGAGALSISKTILFYARALQGVTPNAYWSNTLSHRLVFKEASGFTDVFLYHANIKTGGVGTTYTDIARIKGDKDSAASLIGTYLPDVPLYKPGTNLSITSQMEDSYATKISGDPTLKAWLRTSMKSGFNYAYVIRSAWVPKYRVGKFVLSRSPTHLLGTRSGYAMDGFIPSQTVPEADPANNTHMDWLRATTWSKSNFKGVSTFKPSMETLKFDPFGNKQNVPEFYEGRNALTATEMHCVAFPKRAAENIAKFMEGVPALLSEYLNKNLNQRNGPWYDAQRTLTREEFFGSLDTLKSRHPSYLKRVSGQAREEWGFNEGEFYNTYDHVRTFLLNRTESLFIQDPADAATKAYNKRMQKSFPKGVGQPNFYNTTLFYDHNDFGNAYSSYMSLLGAIAYFNSYEMLTDSPSNRTFAPWAKPFAGEINSIVSSVLGSSAPQTIFTTQINDTADVSSMHKTLKGLGAFDEMLEMPVFDLKEFHAVWQPITSTGSPALDSPFIAGGFLNVPQGGLKTTIFPGLKGTYGDVFYQTMMETCVLNPVISASLKGYVYSSVRIPVNTRGLSSKVYGLRPGTTYAFDQGSNKVDISRALSTGSGRISYTKMAGGAGLLFASVLGIAMYKNIANENAWKDKRFEIDYN